MPPSTPSQRRPQQKFNSPNAYTFRLSPRSGLMNKLNIDPKNVRFIFLFVIKDVYFRLIVCNFVWMFLFLIILIWLDLVEGKARFAQILMVLGS